MHFGKLFPRFDGDGCLTFDRSRNVIHASFTGYKPFVESIHRILRNALDMKTGFISHLKTKDPGVQLAHLVFGGIESPLKVLHFMYKDSTENTRLSRKFHLFQACQRICALPPKKRTNAWDEYKNSQEWINLTSCARGDDCARD